MANAVCFQSPVSDSCWLTFFGTDKDIKKNWEKRNRQGCMSKSGPQKAHGEENVQVCVT